MILAIIYMWKEVYRTMLWNRNQIYSILSCLSIGQITFFNYNLDTFYGPLIVQDVYVLPIKISLKFPYEWFNGRW